ncbi:MAG: toprim domain-containing protein [Deltaproteobacteria bacterium]|nr:MAG: toprim domain-containing protein [Deltaproteobacteria bacterium]
MKKGWVDFKHIKESVTFEQVLDRYGLQLKPAKGKELLGLCPFHEDTKPSFRVNTEKRVFHCFGCGAKGNVLDFVARKENVPIKKAALLVSEWFGTGEREIEAPSANLRPTEAPKRAETSHIEPIEPNKPLTFTLKLKPEHPYLGQRGIEPELAQHFGIGFCDRGLMRDRVAIPIHDVDGQLVAYAGRWVSGKLPEGEEKYKLPPGFKKSLVLYNLNRVKGKSRLVLVEGFFSVLRLHKLGIDAVALMGRTLSVEQEKLLVESGVRYLTLLLDGDPPGRQAQAELLPRLANKFHVLSVELPEGTDPDTVEESALMDLLATERGEL